MRHSGECGTLTHATTYIEPKKKTKTTNEAIRRTDIFNGIERMEMKEKTICIVYIVYTVACKVMGRRKSTKKNVSYAMAMCMGCVFVR